MVSVRSQTRFLGCFGSRIFVVFLLFMAYQIAMLQVSPVFVGMQYDIFNATTDCGNQEEGACAAAGAVYQTSVQGTAAFLMMLTAPLYGVYADSVGRKYLYILAQLALVLSCFCLLGPPATLTPYYIVTAVVGVFPEPIMMTFTVLSDVVPSSQIVWYFANFTSVFLSFGAVGSAIASVTILYLKPQEVIQLVICVSFCIFVLFALVMPETLPSKRKAKLGDGRLPPPKEDRKSSRKSSPPPQSVPRTKSVAQVLFTAENDEDRWQRGFYWLFVLSSVPDLGIWGILLFYCEGQYNFTTPELSRLQSLYMGSAVLWGSFLLIPLRMILSNDARVFQVCVVVNALHLFPVVFMKQHWTPYLVTIFAGAGLLQPTLLRGMIANLTDAEHQGRVNGILGACQSVCKALAPPVMSWLFSTGTAIGFPSLPFVFCGAVILPVSLVISSFWLLPQCMPKSMQAKLRRRGELQEEEDQSLLRKGLEPEFNAPLLSSGSEALVNDVNELKTELNSALALLASERQARLQLEARFLSEIAQIRTWPNPPQAEPRK